MIPNVIVDCCNLIVPPKENLKNCDYEAHNMHKLRVAFFIIGYNRSTPYFSGIKRVFYFISGGFMRNRIMSAILMSFLLAGCALQPSDSFSRRELNQSYRVETGTVERVRNVPIQGTDSGVGTIGGGALGGIAGGAIGGGRGSDIASILGIIGGVLIGHAVEQQATQELGLELTVKLDNGQTALVIQAAEPPFQIGDRVRVLSGKDGKTRVTH